MENERKREPYSRTTLIVVEKHLTQESPFKGCLSKRKYMYIIYFQVAQFACYYIYKPLRVDTREAQQHRNSSPS